jgi:hypothetical protein
VCASVDGIKESAVSDDFYTRRVLHPRPHSRNPRRAEGLLSASEGREGRLRLGFSTDSNPEAPYVILVGGDDDGEEHPVEKKAKLLDAQDEPIPVFLKRASNDWVYEGNSRFSGSPVTGSSLRRSSDGRDGSMLPGTDLGAGMEVRVYGVEQNMDVGGAINRRPTMPHLGRVLRVIGELAAHFPNHGLMLNERYLHHDFSHVLQQAGTPDKVNLLDYRGPTPGITLHPEWPTYKESTGLVLNQA